MITQLSLLGNFYFALLFHKIDMTKWAYVFSVIMTNSTRLKQNELTH